MPKQSFEIDVRQQPRAAIIDLRGEINAAAEPSINSAYELAERGEPEVIVLNFSEVGYINSTGIALVVGLLARARKSKRTIRACGLNDHYREIFEITRLADFMHVYRDEDSALQQVI